MDLSATAIILSCEHAVNTIPEAYAGYVDERLLNTHEGIDIGALGVATQLHTILQYPLFTGTVCRLLIDLHRTLHHPKLFSRFSKKMSFELKKQLLETQYRPYRDNILTCLESLLLSHRHVIHYSIHSFTPVLNGVIRTADIGILYDPKRSSEKNLGHLLSKNFKMKMPDYRIRKNYPYLGINDGLTSDLRKKFSENQYTGIEIEINQGLIGNEPLQKEMGEMIAKVLR